MTLNAKQVSEDTFECYHGRSCIVKLMNMQLQKGGYRLWTFHDRHGDFTLLRRRSDDDCVHAERPATASS